MFIHFKPDGDLAGGPGITDDGTHVVTPQTGSAVEQATKLALENIAAGKTADGRVRASDGTFAPPLPEGAPAPGAADGKPAPADGQAPAGDQKPEGEGEGTPAGDEAPNELVVSMLDEAGQPVEIEFADPAIAARVRETVEIAQEATEMMANARQQIDDVLMVREAVNTDPVGFVLGEIGRKPAAVEHLVLTLLTGETPEAQALRDKVAKTIADPNELRMTRAEQKAARSEFRETAATEIAASRAVAENLQNVKTAVAAVLPGTYTPDQQRVFYADCLRDLKHYADRHDLDTIPIEDVPMILRNRFTAAGIDPLAAAGVMSAAIQRPARRGAPAARKPAVAPGGTPGVKPGAPNGQAFVQSQERRRVAASVPAGGAGSPSGGGELVAPKNPDGSPMGTAQTLAWHREQTQKGRKFLVPTQ
jgi:hypothetical protein